MRTNRNEEAAVFIRLSERLLIGCGIQCCFGLCQEVGWRDILMKVQQEVKCFQLLCSIPSSLLTDEASRTPAEALIQPARPQVTSANLQFSITKMLTEISGQNKFETLFFWPDEGASVDKR